jgi:hypothetical protein
VKLSEELLPALSVQLPVWSCCRVSGPLIGTGALQEAIPEVGSTPLQLTTAAPEPAVRVRRGGSASPWWPAPCVVVRTTESDELLPALSVQLPLRVTPVVSGPL